MFKSPVVSYLKANQLLWQKGCWKTMLAPIVISAVLFPALLFVSYLSASGITDWLDGRFFEDSTFPGWIRFILVSSLFMACLAPCYVMFRGLVMLCYAPFLDQLSERAEKLLLGGIKTQKRPLSKILKRAAGMAVISITLALAVVLLGFGISTIPLVGPLLVGFVVFPLELFLSSLGFIDPYLDRTGLSSRDALRLLRKYFWRTTFFGFIGLCLMMVPVIGWFVGPTYSVTAGVVMGILISEEESESDA